MYGNRIPGLGYLWIFPLGNGRYHIGVGGLGLVDHDSIMEQYYRESSDRFSFTRLCRCTGVVRVASPLLLDTVLYIRDPERRDIAARRRCRRIHRDSIAVHRGRNRLFP